MSAGAVKPLVTFSRLRLSPAVVSARAPGWGERFDVPMRAKTRAALLCAAPAVLSVAALAQTTPGAAPPAAEIALPDVDVVGTAPLPAPASTRPRCRPTPRCCGARTSCAPARPARLRALDERVGNVRWTRRRATRSSPTCSYRGFEASPLAGNPQGLAVYVNGTRFNQPFGDTTNWDLIPDIAIDRIELLGANPAFGLNALGGTRHGQAARRVHLSRRRAGAVRRLVRPHPGLGRSMACSPATPPPTSPAPG